MEDRSLTRRAALRKLGIWRLRRGPRIARRHRCGLIKQFGKVLQRSRYGSFHDGHWTAVPISQGTIAAPTCGRIDLLNWIKQLSNEGQDHVEENQ